MCIYRATVICYTRTRCVRSCSSPAIKTYLVVSLLALRTAPTLILRRDMARFFFLFAERLIHLPDSSFDLSAELGDL